MNNKGKSMDNKEEIMVSVFCTAYNHEKYIRDCLEGFVKQKTNFKFEVLINDDASTDNTASIIREYEKKYPDIIKPIYQKENQYSKGISIYRQILVPEASGGGGRYIAFCEGDDFWTDELKLQKQVDALEKNLDCNMCVARVRDVAENGEYTNNFHPSKNYRGGKYKPKDFLKIALSEYAFQTSSFVVRKSIYDIYINLDADFKNFAKNAGVGDWPLMLFFGQYSDIYYFDDEMSCYRRNSVGSFSDRVSTFNMEKTKYYYNNMILMAQSFDKFTGYKFTDECKNFIHRFDRYIYNCLLQEKSYKDIVKGKYRKFLKNENIKDKIFIYLSVYCPYLVKIIYKIHTF